MKKTLTILAVLATLIFAAIYIPKKIQSLKEKFVTDLIQNSFKEDILFVAEVMPAFCIEEEVLIKYMFDEAYLAANYDLGMEKKNVLIIGFLEEFSNGLQTAKPQNEYHQELQKNMLAHFKKHKIGELTLENVDARIEDLYLFFTSLEGVLEKSKTEAYFSEKFADVHQEKRDEREKFGSKSKSNGWMNKRIDGKTLDAAILAINKIAKQNANYQVAYENGCMKNFMSGLKYFLLTKNKR